MNPLAPWVLKLPKGNGEPLYTLKDIVGDGYVSHWRIDKIKKDEKWTKVTTVTLRSYPHSGSHAMQVGWEKYEPLFRELYRAGYVLAPEQIV